MFHFTDELVTTAQLADRYRAADRALLLRTSTEPDLPGRAALVRIGHLLVALGHRLEALDTNCTTGRPLDAAVAVQEC